MKVLVVRTDRLGDLVLSLPALDLIARERPGWELHAMVAPEALPLVEHHPALAGVWSWRPGAGGCDARALRHDLRRARFDAAVLLQYRRELAWLLRRAGVPRLHGPRSKPSSFLLLNRGRWQGRSRSGRHERDLNADLVRDLLDAPGVPVPRPRLHLSDAQRAAGAAFRAERAAGADTVAFVHPGSGGSALDWPPDRFAEVANALAARPGWRVFVTGAGRDAAAVRAVACRLEPGIPVLLDAFDLRSFLGVLAAGDVMVAPSTGPLHLAAALDLAVVGLYPPLPTMAPARWGPCGRWARTLVPAVACPERRTCRGPRCPLHDCMERIAAAEVAAAAADAAAQRGRERAAPAPVEEEST